jgi:phage minor structural protein
MVFIYAPDATPAECLTNGYGHIDVLKCTVYEQVNGEFTCNISIPVDSENAEYFVREAIIKCPTHRGVQLFRLAKPIFDMQQTTAVGWHISYDMANDVIMSGDFSAKTGVLALPLVLAAGTYETRFSGTSDISTLNNMLIVRGSLLGALINVADDNCFLTKWGGEIERDNFVFNIPASIGADNGMRVAYKKNLTGMKITEDDSKVATRIIPTCLDEDDSILALTEVYIDSDNIDDYPLPKIRTIHYKDIKVGKEVDGSVTYPTQASARSEMQARVAALYTAKIDLPRVTVDINFELLGDTAEYSEYADLESVSLGDTIKGGYRGIIFDHRVAAINYDGVADKMESVILGAVKSNFASSKYAQDINISALNDKFSTAVMQGDKYNEVYIDHTDGFVASCASLNSKAVLNGSKIGFYDATTDAFLGGLASVDSLVALIAQVLTDSESPDFYAKIGTHTDDDSKEWHGIRGFLETDGSYVNTVAIDSMWDDTNELLRLRVYIPTDEEYGSLALEQLIDSAGQSNSLICKDAMLILSDSFSTDNAKSYMLVEYDGDTLQFGIIHDKFKYSYSDGTTTVQTECELPQIQFGSVECNSTTSVDVTFDEPFRNIPVVVPGVNTTDSGVIAAKFHTITKTGFKAVIGGSGFSGIDCSWIAMANL